MHELSLAVLVRLPLGVIVIEVREVICDWPSQPHFHCGQRSQHRAMVEYEVTIEATQPPGGGHLSCRREYIGWQFDSIRRQDMDN